MIQALTLLHLSRPSFFRWLSKFRYLASVAPMVFILDHRKIAVRGPLLLDLWRPSGLGLLLKDMVCTRDGFNVEFVGWPSGRDIAGKMRPPDCSSRGAGASGTAFVSCPCLWGKSVVLPSQFSVVSEQSIASCSNIGSRDSLWINQSKRRYKNTCSKVAKLLLRKML